MKWQPTPVFLPGEFHGQRSLVGYSPRGGKVRHNWATNTHIYTLELPLICTHSQIQKISPQLNPYYFYLLCLNPEFTIVSLVQIATVIEFLITSTTNTVYSEPVITVIPLCLSYFLTPATKHLMFTMLQVAWPHEHMTSLARTFFLFSSKFCPILASLAALFL